MHPKSTHPASTKGKSLRDAAVSSKKIKSLYDRRALVWRGRLGRGRHCSVGLVRLPFHTLDACRRTALRHAVWAPHVLTSRIRVRPGRACGLFFPPPLLV